MSYRLVFTMMNNTQSMKRGCTILTHYVSVLCHSLMLTYLIHIFLRSYVGNPVSSVQTMEGFRGLSLIPFYYIVGHHQTCNIRSVDP